MPGSLCSCETNDGIKLNGFFATGTPDCSEAWILVHGVNSNFYSSSLLTGLASTLNSDGMGVLLANTRGHDILSFNTGKSPCRLGAQIERLDGAIADLDAWVKYLQDQGISQIGLLGHSLGALKICLWLSKRHHAVKIAVLLSPPRLNTDLLLADHEKGKVLQQHLQDALELCAAGNPDHVMKVRYPIPMWICASTYADKYGSGTKYDYLELASQVDANCLWVFGSKEVKLGNSNFKDADQKLQEQLTGCGLEQKQSVEVIEGADHAYNGQSLSLTHTIRKWLTQRYSK
jgi:alpha/beta superfamily hydrolase